MFSIFYGITVLFLPKFYSHQTWKSSSDLKVIFSMYKPLWQKILFYRVEMEVYFQTPTPNSCYLFIAIVFVVKLYKAVLPNVSLFIPVLLIFASFAEQLTARNCINRIINSNKCLKTSLIHIRRCPSRRILAAASPLPKRVFRNL